MVNRIAGILALIAFAMTALVGVVDANNGFASAVGRALMAMLGTYVVGYLIGLAAERMLSENLSATETRLIAEREEKLRAAQESATDGR